MGWWIALAAVGGFGLGWICRRSDSADVIRALGEQHQEEIARMQRALAARKRSTKRSNLEAATRIAVAESRYERCAREVAAQQARQIAGEAS